MFLIHWLHLMDGYSCKKVCSGSKNHYGVRNTSKACSCTSYGYKTHKNEPFPPEFWWTKALEFILHIVSVYPTFLFEAACREGKETKEMLQAVTWHSVCLPWPGDDADSSAQGTYVHIRMYMDTHIYIYMNIYIYMHVSTHDTVNHWSPLLERECKRQDVASATSPFSPKWGSTLYVKQGLKLEPKYWSRCNRFDQCTVCSCIIENFYQIPGLWVRLQCLTVSNFR